MAGAYERREIDSAKTADLFVKRGGAGISAAEEKAGKRGKGGRFPVVGTTGLYLLVRPAKQGFSASWVVRLKRDGKETTKTVKYKSVGDAVGKTLKEAREWANEIRAAWANNRDIVKERREERKAKESALPDTISGLFPIWYGDPQNRLSTRERAHRAVFLQFRKHVEPYLGKMRPDAVSPADVGKVLTPLALAHRAVFAKTRTFLECFFQWCARVDVNKLSPDRRNPATTYELRPYLPRSPMRAKNKANPMCSVPDLRRLVRMLTEGRRFNTAAAALLFQILTASRIGNVAYEPESPDVRTYAVWEDIDMAARIWRIPAQKMKIKDLENDANGDHIIPLSNQAIAILERMKRLDEEEQGAVFRTSRGAPMYQGALRKAIPKADAEDREQGGAGFRDKNGRLAVPHGIARACFRTWGAEKGYSVPALEVALHHKIDDRHYDRSTRVEARREIMQAWADEIFRDCPEDWADVKP